MARPVRIVIVDNQPIFREGLRKLLEAEPDLTVAGEGRNDEEVVGLIEQLLPDILLFDGGVLHRFGLLALRRIQKCHPPMRTILLVSEVDRTEVVSALQLGARGIVIKVAASEVLLNAIRTVMDGRYWIRDECVDDLVETFHKMMVEAAPSSSPFGLTRRELEIVAMIAVGRTNRKIADTLSLSEDTVKHHLTAIFEKVRVSSRLELALFAAHHRLPTS